jgi:hypothetical protein
MLTAGMGDSDSVPIVKLKEALSSKEAFRTQYLVSVPNQVLSILFFVSLLCVPGCFKQGVDQLSLAQGL